MKKHLDILTRDQAVANLGSHQDHPSRQNYLAMFSTWLGGIVKDPNLMIVPVDDHLVHRGDGIFEAIKCVDGRIYTLERHLQRLARSAEIVQMKLPFSLEEMTEIIVETVRASEAKDALIRLFISRGPGGFTTNPYESMGSQMYLVITKPSALSSDKYFRGVKLKTSAIPVKEGFFANVKSCNYLPNVLMKKEAVDANVDFTVSLDEKGYLAEGSTENFAIISKSKKFLVPNFERILRGVTVTRMMELARELVERGELKSIEETRLRPADVYEASEAMMLGTTLDAIGVVSYDGHSIGNGNPGPLTKKFCELIRKDQRDGEGVTTQV